MNFEELNNLYLKIGRNRREEFSTDKTSNGRRVIGRKGIGKLSVFGVAEVVKIESIKDNHKICFEMDLNDIKKVKVGFINQRLLKI